MMSRILTNGDIIFRSSRKYEHAEQKSLSYFVCLSVLEMFKTKYQSLIRVNSHHYFMFSGRISRNIGENIFQSYTGTTSENTDFHILVA